MVRILFSCSARAFKIHYEISVSTACNVTAKVVLNSAHLRHCRILKTFQKNAVVPHRSLQNIVGCYDFVQFCVRIYS